MDRNRESLPPSTFTKGTTYYGDSRDQRFRSRDFLVNDNKKNETQEKPRIARPDDLAKYALNNIPQETSPEKEAEEEHLKRLFAFPDERDDRMFMRTSVTEDSLKDALDAYRSTDSTIKKIVNEYAINGVSVPYEDVAKVLRSNDDLRIELGKYLLERLNQPEAFYYLQSRHMNDAERKRPNIAGYDEPMTSKEYSVLLALSMLDGTFEHGYNHDNPLDKPSDKIYLSKYDDGLVEAGQHRWVALHLLGQQKRIYDYSEKRK